MHRVHRSANVAPEIYDMHGMGVGSILLDASLLVNPQLDRASSVQKTDISVSDVSSLRA